MNRYKLIAAVTIITLISCKKEHTDNAEITPCDVNESYFDGFEVVNSLDGKTDITNEPITVSHKNFTPAIGEWYPGYSIYINMYDSKKREIKIVHNQITRPVSNKDLRITPLLQDKKYFYYITLSKRLNGDDMFCENYSYEAVIETLPTIYSFKTRKAKYPVGLVSDIDGNLYETVTIGSQEWLAQNLRSNRYNNGDTIPSSYLLGKTYDYLVSEKGRYYLPKAVFTNRNPCPKGWHVPSDSEFDELINTLMQLYGNSYINEIYTYSNNETYLSLDLVGIEGGVYLTKTLKNDSVVYAYQGRYYYGRTFDKFEISINDPDYTSRACIRCIKD